MAVKFPRVYNFADMNAGTSATDVALVAGVWTKIASIQVPAQQQVAFGAGEIANGVDSREYVKLQIDSLAGSITGKVRFAYHDANETNVVVVMEQRTDNLNGGTSVKMAEVKNLRAREDSYLAIYVNPDSSTTLDYSDTDNVLLLPVSIYQ